MLLRRTLKPKCISRRLKKRVPQHQPISLTTSLLSHDNRIFQRINARSIRFYAQKAERDLNLTPVGKNLIPAVNKLQEIFSMVGNKLDLPQVVVIGSQSSGKSSVLESLVGRDFLPRGTGIVTRRPLILQLHKLKEGEKEYGVFSHKPNQNIYDFDEIRSEISRETDRVAGNNRGVSTVPIILRIYSPYVLPLTLVDTPGLARVAVGDQPQDIEKQIRAMVHEYINMKNAIILAVTAGNQDIATSDAIHMAKSVDPDGSRTIGVLTKLDLMDKGTDAMPVLLGRTVPLRSGWVGVVNRSQDDINTKKSIGNAIKDEKNFFDSHVSYKTISDRCGNQFLGEKCSKVLTEHIRKTLPGLRAEINKLIQERSEELSSYGEPLPEDEVSKGWHLLQILNKFSVDLSSAIAGTNDIGSSELNGGARIRYIFHESFQKNIGNVRPESILGDQDIRTAIRNAAGPKAALFVPDSAFELLARKHIELLRHPSVLCSDMVYTELLRIIAQIENKDMMRFPKLQDKTMEIANKLIRKKLKETNALIHQLIEFELAYINTSHPDFVGVNVLLNENEHKKTNNNDSWKNAATVNEQSVSENSGFFSSLFFGSKNPEPQPKGTKAPNELVIDKTISDREKTQIRLIKKLLESYGSIVSKNIQDQVAKVIMHGLVNAVCRDIQKELVSALYKGGTTNASDLLMEAGDIEMKRKVCIKELDALHKAKKVITMSELMDGW
eukprot:TRINITY_DN4484_c1_g2_i1.p1 TRINITY_DN4484_c1_g2~~TRINITY_DN4484_c1_g2_i1.p1  ORF type:complete len:724 (+),score=140.97 TRINITY_DN4484_c1_g2_i1:25-2196(+)